MLASVMTLAFLFVLTGLQHLDGLVDVGNALGIRKASVEERIKIAHAWVVTRPGAFMAIIVSFCALVFIFLTKPDSKSHAVYSLFKKIPNTKKEEYRIK